MNPLTSHHVETNAHINNLEKGISTLRTPPAQKASFSADSNAIEILRNQRLRRGRAIAATQRVITLKI